MKTKERIAILRHILDELEENMIDDPVVCSFRGHYFGCRKHFIKRHKQAKEWVKSELDSALERKGK